MIFDRVIRATFQKFANFGPPVPYCLVAQEQNPFFLFGPTLLANLRVEMIMPSLPALFTKSA